LNVNQKSENYRKKLKKIGDKDTFKVFMFTNCKKNKTKTSQIQ